MRHFEYIVVSIVEGKWDDFFSFQHILPTPNPSQDGNIAEECILTAQVEYYEKISSQLCTFNLYDKYGNNRRFSSVSIPFSLSNRIFVGR